jgi:hypothetical protein
MSSSARLHAEEIEPSHSRFLFKKKITKRPPIEWLSALLPQPPLGKRRVAAVSAAAGASRSREMSTARAHRAPCSLSPVITGRARGHAGAACSQLQARLESTRQARRVPCPALSVTGERLCCGAVKGHLFASSQTIATKSSFAGHGSIIDTARKHRRIKMKRGLVGIKQMVICTLLPQHLVKL